MENVTGNHPTRPEIGFYGDISGAFNPAKPNVRLTVIRQREVEMDSFPEETKAEVNRGTEERRKLPSRGGCGSTAGRGYFGHAREMMV